MIRANNWYVPQGQIIISNVNESANFVTTSGGAKLLYDRSPAWTVPTDWIDPITHTFQVQFADATARSTFFSNGGQIRFSASLAGGASNPQNTSYSAMLASMGTVVFGNTDTTNTGSSGTGSSVGFTNLTTSDQTIFTTNSTASNYTDDEYKIEARLFLTNRIIFTITFTNDTDNVLNEPVTGTLTSLIDERRLVTDTSPTYSTRFDDTDLDKSGLTEQILLQGPVNYWRLDETSGTTFADSMGNNNLSLNTGSAADITATPSRSDFVGNSIRVRDGVSSMRIDTDNPMALANGDFTFMFAMDFSSTNQVSEADYNILAIYDGANPHFRFFIDDSELQIESNAGGVQRIETLLDISGVASANPNAPFWYVIVADTNESLLKMYAANDVPETEIDISTWNTNWLSTASSTVSSPMYVATGPSSTNRAPGIIDEVVYYDKALTDSEQYEITLWWENDEGGEGGEGGE
jgi:hypothetical protein